MAVVFISPKQRQKMFFTGITVIFSLILAAIFLGVFFSEPKASSPTLVFNKPKVSIDMSILDSEQFNDLQPFPEMKTQYIYKAVAKNNKAQTGFIFADSLEDAKTILKNMGLVVNDIQEAKIGRDNPFEPYYQSSPQIELKK